MILDIQCSYLYKEYGAGDFLRALNGFANPNFVWTIAPFICLRS